MELWLADVEDVLWSSPQQVRERYASATVRETNRVTFQLGNHGYELDVTVAYRTSAVVVRGVHPRTQLVQTVDGENSAAA